MFFPKQHNQHFLAALVSAAGRLSFVAAEDIHDASGAKLLPVNQEIGADTLEQLARRPLLRPLEASLRVRNGVTAAELQRQATRLCEDSAFLAAVVGRDFARLRRLYLSLPLDPFVRLVLSVAQASRPRLFSHSLLFSILAGTLEIKQGGPELNAELALLAGMVHDIGELYASPDIPDFVAGASRGRWQDIAAHPDAGSQAIERFADCPKSVSRAVSEHHERLDGSGYPRGVSGDAISPLGRILSLVETICGIMNVPDNHGARTRVAVSFVTGEFDPQLVHLLNTSLAGALAGEIALPAEFRLGAALEQARLMSEALGDALRRIKPLAHARIEDSEMRELVAFAHSRIERLNSSWEATGIGEYFANSASLSLSEEDERIYFDLDVVTREMIWRMRSLARQIGLMLRRSSLSGYGVLESVITALEVPES